TRARTQGRGGLGSIVVFSSGNSNQAFSGVTFPANVNGVVTVGAIDRNGNIWNYSSRGLELDLVAPSGNTGLNGDVVTTDRMGNLGYDNDNYTDTFGGTSAAAPQVAGVAALMLSISPDLTEGEVRTILQSTATDMGTPGFGDIFGYGRLNAHAAVQAALPLISGPDVLCSSNSYTLQDLPPGTTATWTASPSHLFSVGSGTGVTANLGPGAAASGQGTLTFTISGSCGTVQVSKQVWVGKALPSPTFSQGPYEMAVNTVHNFYVNSVPTATNYQWRVYPSGNEWIRSNGNSGITLSISAAGSYSLEVDITNPCGVIGLETPVDVSLFSALFTVYPNPASEELHIEMIPSEKPEKQGVDVLDHTVYEIKLFDPSGIELHSQVASDTKVTLNVRHLDNGFYY